MDIIIIALFSYISGSIPFGFLVTKIFGKIDVRNIGSGNIGATNVLRTGNKFLALITLILDILKGFVPVFISSILTANSFLFKFNCFWPLYFCKLFRN